MDAEASESGGLDRRHEGERAAMFPCTMQAEPLTAHVPLGLTTLRDSMFLYHFQLEK